VSRSLRHARYLNGSCVTPASASAHARPCAQSVLARVRTRFCRHLPAANALECILSASIPASVVRAGCACCRCTLETSVWLRVAKRREPNKPMCAARPLWVLALASRATRQNGLPPMTGLTNTYQPYPHLRLA
jgi:hypothetical protein